MLKDSIYKFYLRIVLPSVLAMALFIVSIFAIIIPGFERTMLENKKEMISELTNAAWSIMDEYQLKYEEDNIPLAEAQEQAAAAIELMRYGSERKDYFWIVDMRPFMVMHPYRPELNGTDLSKYQDPEGSFLFMEAVETVKEHEEGFINYIWQWKDDSTRMVPKLSYVKAYPEWNWIIGTGIYLDDVDQEIASLRGRLFRISVLIIVVISIALFSIIRQSLNIENKRKKAEQSLILSRQRYKSLVEASTEGTLMLINEQIIFANLKLAEMLECASSDILSKSFNELFELQWAEVLKKFTDPNKSVTLETQIKCCNDTKKAVIISVSKVAYASGDSYIVITKDVTRQKRLEKGSAQLSQEMQMSLLLMNQPIRPYIKELITCAPDTTIGDAAALMTRKNSDVIFVIFNNRVIGVITDIDLKVRVLAQNLEYGTTVSEVMSAPVIAISSDALLYEALLMFKNEDVSHLLVRNLQRENLGVINYYEILSLQQNSVNFIIREIEAAENIETLERISNRTPVLVNALLESGDKTDNITRVITSISDALTVRLIELAIEKIGPPPCEFAFMALGSEGRKEQTLSTDQDNAIVYQDLDTESEEEAKRYFALLAKDVNTKLNTIGFRFCKGDIMAMNPKWTQSLNKWKAYFTSWITSSDPQSILDSCIFFDLRCIYGKSDMIEYLVDHIHAESENQAVFFQHMANPIIRAKSRVSMFGSIVGDEEGHESKRIDIKKIQMPLTGFARIYALKNKIRETNTLRRYEKLYKQDLISKELYNEITVSYSFLMQLRLRFQSQEELNNVPPDNMVEMDQLTTIEVATLKKVLSELAGLQTQLSFDFKGGV